MSDDDGRGARSAAWGVLAAVSGAGAFAVWVAAATPGSKFPIWPAFIFGALAAAGLYMCFASLSGWWPIGRILRRTSRAAPPPALVVKIKDVRWENWKYIALIAAFHVEITNTTNRAILIASYGFTTDNRGLRSWEFNATSEQNMAVRREAYARQEGHRYGPSLRIHSEVPAHQAVSGWFVTAVTRDPWGGTPECTIVIEDDIGNEYPATVARQEARKRLLDQVGSGICPPGTAGPGPSHPPDRDHLTQRHPDDHKRVADGKPTDQVSDKAHSETQHRELAERASREDAEARQVLVTIEAKEHPGTGHNFNRRVTLSTPHTYPIKQVEGCMALPSNGGLGTIGFGHAGDAPRVDEQRIYYDFWAEVPEKVPEAVPIMRFVDLHGNRYYQYKHHTQRFSCTTDWLEAAREIDQWMRTGPKPD